MSREKQYTEREKVLAERAAFERGWDIAVMTTHPGRLDDPAGERAKRLYPLPKVTRPREVRDPHCGEFWWSIRGDALYVYHSSVGHEAYPRHGEGIHASLERVRVWADLLANPTEEVEAES